ncbi:hypothetical protein ACFVFQ_34795 [Streptomyces sp. NPDC057743]|uniref:hypothetical protein n=1 Tax=Streptomyces sp. NPDC057743 TaxID=3346236 RepID=UPI0036CA83F6
MHASLAERPARPQKSVQPASGPLPLLVERRLPGELFPRVPVRSFQLTREQVASALFLQRRTLDVLPTDMELLDAAGRALDFHGLSGVTARIADLEAEDAPERDVNDAWCYAYRLCVEHWYQDAVSEWIGQYLMAAALYVSDAPSTALRRLSPAEFDGHLAEGVARIGVRALVRLGDGARREFGNPHMDRVPESWLEADYLAAMPKRGRRKACHEAAMARQLGGPRALMVWFDDGRYAVGATPPENPLTAAYDAQLRARAARRKARVAA